MVRKVKSIGALVLRLIVGLALLGWSQIGSAAGTWSVIPFPVKPGEVNSPTAVAVDAVGNLYIADESNGGRIQKRDAQGNWSVIASTGSDPAHGRALPGGAVVAAGAVARR